MSEKFLLECANYFDLSRGMPVHTMKQTVKMGGYIPSRTQSPRKGKPDKTNCPAWLEKRDEWPNPGARVVGAYAVMCSADILRFLVYKYGSASVQIGVGGGYHNYEKSVDNGYRWYVILCGS